MTNCSERANLLGLLSFVLFCGFATFPFGVLGQVWYLIELIPGLEVIKLEVHS